MAFHHQNQCFINFGWICSHSFHYVSFRFVSFRLHVNNTNYQILFRNSIPCTLYAIQYSTFNISHSHPAKMLNNHGMFINKEKTWTFSCLEKYLFRSSNKIVSISSFHSMKVCVCVILSTSQWIFNELNSTWSIKYARKPSVNHISLIM